MPRKLVAEFVGTAFLLALVVGSGIMAERLSGGNVALALLANAAATAAGLIALILTFCGISGAHFNPVVTLVDVCARKRTWSEGGAYCLAQLIGAVSGVAIAHAMFGEDLFSASTRARSGFGQWLGEGIATFGLVAVIMSCVKQHPKKVAPAVGAYIGAAYWFTSSTSFANPAVTLARSLTDTFTGIRPIDTPAFIGAQLLGAVSAFLLMRWLLATAIQE